MDTYTEIVVATLGATGYGRLQPGEELTKLLISECAAAEKVENARRNPILAKVTPPLTPAQEMKLTLKRVISSIREMVIEEAREVIKAELAMEMEVNALSVAKPPPQFVPKTPAAEPTPLPTPPPTPKSRPKIGQTGAAPRQSLEENPLYKLVNTNLGRINSGKAKTIDEFIDERKGRIDPQIAQELREVSVEDPEEEVENEAWGKMEAAFYKSL